MKAEGKNGGENYDATKWVAMNKMAISRETWKWALSQVPKYENLTEEELEKLVDRTIEECEQKRRAREAGQTPPPLNEPESQN